MIVDARLIKSFQQSCIEDKERVVGDSINADDWTNMVVAARIMHAAKTSDFPGCRIDIPYYIDDEAVADILTQSGYFVERDNENQMTISW